MKHGFTLIELIVVISVIAILAGIVTPVAGILIDESRVLRGKTDIDALGKSCIMFDSHYRSLPFVGLPGGSAGYSYAYNPAETDVLNDLLLGANNRVNATQNPSGMTVKQFISQRCTYDPWATCYKYHNYTQSGRATLVFCHFGANKANNGVWDYNLWTRSGNAPSDDYYKMFR